MKKSIFLLAAVTFISLTSFTKVENPTIQFGTYGGDGVTGPKIELNSDYSFHYLDNTNRNNPIEVTGKWEIVDGQVHLQDISNKKVMDDLDIVCEGGCLKARKGMAFYTLCRN